MSSLSAHLRESGDHGRLRFHADCPVCRQERLSGTLSSESVVSRRAQAALVTGALAISLVGPPSVWAQEPDSQQEGQTAPQYPGGETPGFDPGGDTELPFNVEAPQGPTEDSTGDAGPLETEPQVDPDVRQVPSTESEDATPPDSDETPVPPAAPGPPAAGSPVAPEPVHPKVEGTSAADRRAARNRAAREAHKAARDSRQQLEQASSPSADQPATTVTLQTAAAASQGSSVEVAPSPERNTAEGSRFHVVRPGESLWSIAKGLLGSDASVARVARKVDRLWELNKDRIATGDPDLLRVGTELRLR
jgi:LysM domain-containing protein